MIRMPFTYKSRHEKLRLLLSDYIDGELDSTESARIEAHLASCENCRWELSTLKSTVDMLKGLPTPAPLRSFVLQEEPRPAAAQSPLYVWGVRYAASAAVLLFVVMVAGNLTGVLSQSSTQYSGAPVRSEATLTGGAAEKSLQTPLPTTVPDSGAAVGPPSMAPQATASPAPATSSVDRAYETSGGAVATPELLDLSVPQESAAWLSLPLWQLETAIGAIALLLGTIAFWLTLRRNPSH